MLASENTEIPFSEVVRLVQAGGAEGMTALYGFLARGLRPYLARQLDTQDVQDKLHDVFLEVLRAIQRGQLRDPERLMGFARTVARRKVAIHIDRATRSRREQAGFGLIFGLSRSPSTPEGLVISREHREMVSKTLLQLSGRERDVLTRFYLQEENQAQICEEMGLTETQFRLLKWRSKARFAQLSRNTLLGRRGMGRSSAPIKASVPA